MKSKVIIVIVGTMVLVCGLALSGLCGEAENVREAYPFTGPL